MFTRAVSVVYLLSSLLVCHTIFSSTKRDDTISVTLLSITFAAVIAQEIFSGPRKQSFTRPSASSGIIDGVVLVPLLLASFKPLIENDNSSKILSDLFYISCLNGGQFLFGYSGWNPKNQFQLYAAIILNFAFCLYISLFSENVVAFLIAIALHVTTHRTILTKIKYTFTFGEASIVSNTISLFAYFIQRISFESGAFDNQSYYFQHNVIVLALIGETIFSTIMNTNQGTKYSLCFYGATLFIIFGIVAPWVTHIIGAHPVLWIFEDLQQVNNYLLFAYWILCLVILLPIIGWIQKSGVKNIVVRKCFHLLGLIMFVPATWSSPRFLSLGYAVAFAALLILELIKEIRFGNVPPFGASLNKFMGNFIDTRDTGYFTVTHMYLLVGCAAPLWLTCTLGNDNLFVSSFLPVYPPP